MNTVDAAVAGCTFAAAPADEPYAPCGCREERDTILLELPGGALPRPRAELWRSALEVALADQG